jgi:hypothetical protein
MLMLMLMHAAASSSCLQRPAVVIGAYRPDAPCMMHGVGLSAGRRSHTLVRLFGRGVNIAARSVL